MSGQTFPAGPTPADELRGIAERFPARDRHGYVIGFYITAGARGGRIAGPFPSIVAANAHAAETSMVRALAWPFPPTIVCGHVFTSRGTIVRDEAPAEVVGGAA